MLRRDTARVDPVTGLVYIDGAEPGDTLAVTMLSYRPSGWGWTANILGFGLLADEFPESALHIWRISLKAMRLSCTVTLPKSRLRPCPHGGYRAS